MLIKIDGKIYEARSDETLLELAKRKGLDIPSLCHKKEFEGMGRCRLCLVEVDEGRGKKVVSACVYPLKDGIEVWTSSQEIDKMRKDIVFLLLQRSPKNHYIKELAAKFEITAIDRFANSEDEDCILCGLCVEACHKLGTKAISFVGRGTAKKVSTPFDDASLDCIGCGACYEVCPTDAIELLEEDGIRTIWNREFELVSCNMCGKDYETKQALDYTSSLLDAQSEEQLCHLCKRKDIGSGFSQSFKNIY